MYACMNECQALKHDAVMILWDSDIADQSDDIIDKKGTTQLQYKEDLYFILDRLKASNCMYVSVSGALS